MEWNEDPIAGGYNAGNNPPLDDLDTLMGLFHLLDSKSFPRKGEELIFNVAVVFSLYCWDPQTVWLGCCHMSHFCYFCTESVLSVQIAFSSAALAFRYPAIAFLYLSTTLILGIGSCSWKSLSSSLIYTSEFFCPPLLSFVVPLPKSIIHFGKYCG